MRTMRPLATLLAALLVLPLASGCFIVDELDQGQERLDQHSPTRNAHARAKRRGHRADEPAPEATEEAPGLLERAKEWLVAVPELVAGLRFGGGDDDADRPPDPRDAMVRCDVDGGLLFTHRSDCAARGGRIAGSAGGQG